MQSADYSIADIESFCARYYQGRKLSIIPYAYQVNVTGLTQGSTQTVTLTMQANADFIALQFHHRVNIGAAQSVSTKTAPFIRMLVIDTGSNNQFTNAAVDLENYSTNGNIINNLPYPRIVSGRSALQFQFTNYAPTAETYALDLTMDGVQVYAM